MKQYDLLREVKQTAKQTEHYLSLIKAKMQLLLKIPEKERYRFIGYLKKSDNISLVLSCYNDAKTRDKTFQYVAKRYKGNIKQLLEIICRIRF